ncbi:MAG: transposase, partial [Acaryochloridaceae cyanobacterium CSU_3_4]|nr:transposase [Acaryochloridaceae cyanobacterium CSU_3_4]
DLLEQIEPEIEQVSADGAYDTSDCYDAIAQREAKPIIPPRKNDVSTQDHLWGKVCSRQFDNQTTELLCQCAIFNRMIHLGKPDSVPVAA